MPYSTPVGVWSSEGEGLLRQGESQLLARQGRYFNPGSGKGMTGSRIGVANIHKQVSEEKKPVLAEVSSQGDWLNPTVEQDSPLRGAQRREARQ